MFSLRMMTMRAIFRLSIVVFALCALVIAAVARSWALPAPAEMWLIYHGYDEAAQQSATFRLRIDTANAAPDALIMGDRLQAPACSPDGSRFAFAHGETLYTIAAGDDAYTQHDLTPVLRALGWTIANLLNLSITDAGQITTVARGIDWRVVDLVSGDTLYRANTDSYGDYFSMIIAADGGFAVVQRTMYSAVIDWRPTLADPPRPLITAYNLSAAPLPAGGLSVFHDNAPTFGGVLLFDPNRGLHVDHALAAGAIGVWTPDRASILYSAGDGTDQQEVWRIGVRERAGTIVTPRADRVNKDVLCALTFAPPPLRE